MVPGGKKKYLVAHFPQKNSSNHYRGHSSDHSSLTQAIWMVHKEETGPEKAQYNIQILNSLLKCLKDIFPIWLPVALWVLNP